MTGSVDALRLLVGAGFLAYAALLDWRTRRVPNRVWLALGAVGLILVPVDAFVLQTLTWIHVAIALLVMGAAYALWYVHVLAGGADAKAIMALAVLAPTPLAWVALGRQLPLWPSPLPPALVTLSNAVVLFVAIPFLLATYNAMRGDVHVPTMFLGYRMDLEEASRRFVWVVDTVTPEGSLRRIVMPSRRGPEEHAANLERLRQMGFRRVWVTPKIPFMIPLLAGFVAAFTLGDVLFWFLSTQVLG